MNKLYLLVGISIITLFSGCTRNNREDFSNASQYPPQKQTYERKIIDPSGREVEIPNASEIKNIVVLSSPTASFIYDAISEGSTKIVGMDRRAMNSSNQEFLNRHYPFLMDIDTNFIGSDTLINKEKLLKLNPDLIFVHDVNQVNQLQSINIPIVNLSLPNEKESSTEELTTAWDNTIREIFEVNENSTISEEWDLYNQKYEQYRHQIKEEKTVVCIFSIEKGQIMVRGQFTDYVELAGMKNLINKEDNTLVIGFEELHELNPDIILNASEVSSVDILNNNATNKDWTNLNAYKNSMIFDIPKTSYSLAVPSSDSPLLPLWLINKAFPDIVSDDTLEKNIYDYYERRRDLTLKDSDIKLILGEN